MCQPAGCHASLFVSPAYIGTPFSKACANSALKKSSITTCGNGSPCANAACRAFNRASVAQGPKTQDEDM